MSSEETRYEITKMADDLRSDHPVARGFRSRAEAEKARLSRFGNDHRYKVWPYMVTVKFDNRSGVKTVRNRSGNPFATQVHASARWLTDHGVNPWYWDSYRGVRVPVYQLYPNTVADGKNKISVTKLKMTRDGYVSGRYYGAGAPLFYAESDDGRFAMTFRASDKNDAKSKLRAAFPDVEFNR